MANCENVQKVFVPPEEEATVKVAEKPIQGVGITDLAAEKILHFVKSDGKNINEYGLKVAVVSDGCSGKSYTMDLANIEESRKVGDKIFEKNGATVIVEKISFMFVLGSELDYVETLLMSGFQWLNPNVKKTCSCGSSFAV